jgi:uncharacterized repeat protein (TIGR02543 family)
MKYISVIIALLSLFTACDMGGSESVSGGKAVVSVTIGADGIQGRTVKPSLALQEVTEWELLGGEQGEEETELTRFSGVYGASFSIDAGTWSFTLIGYKENAAILEGRITEQAISSTETNTLNFRVAPVLEGEGTISITIELPTGSGVTEARVFKDGQLDTTIAPVDDKIVFEGSYTAGAYYFSVRLYKGDDLYGAVSEAVHVWPSLQSEKAYTLTNEDLNLAYTITYHLWGGETETGYYRYTDATTLIMPSRADYAFKGWYENADFSGDAVAILAGGEGDKDFYAKWAAVSQTPSGLSLADSLLWISSNAEENGAYGITINANEALAPTMLYYDVGNVSITLNGGDAERTVSLNSAGALFTINSGVTLTLGNNVSLQGLGGSYNSNGNTTPLINVNSGGTLTMNAGSKISGNRNSSYTSNGGGVYVNGGTFAMSGGEISGNTANYGGGVSVSGGTFAMSGGTISGITASYGSGYGGGVYVSGGTFAMSGGTISGITASNGSGVSVSGGTFAMSGGAISGNTANYGGGVYVSSGMFTMSGGEISGNTANYGGGVYVSSGTFIKQSGGVIYGANVDDSLKNTASNGNGYAVYVSTYSDSKIRNTTAGVGVVLDSSIIGSAGGWETSLSSDLSFAQSLAWIRANAEEDGIYNITLSANEVVSPQTLSYDGKNVNIMLSGGTSERTISLNSSGSLFAIGNGVTLILGNNVTLLGRNNNTTGLVKVNSGGTLEISAGAKISGNKNTSSSGGGAYIDGGTFTMYGGEVSGNTAFRGGGAYVSGGTFTKRGGTIYGSDADESLKNAATNGGAYGHAVYISDSKKRNTTADVDVILNGSVSGSAGGWQ